MRNRGAGVSDVNSVFANRGGWAGMWLAPLGRHFWMIVLIVTVGVLSVRAYGQLQPPSYEATAVLQSQSGIPASHVSELMLGRENLLSIAARHGFRLKGASLDQTAVQLRRAIAINDLTSPAGQASGFPAQSAGVVVSVLLPDPEVAARLANDLAQQILDAGNAGQLGEDHQELDFYRRDEARLWQEVSALQAEQDRVSVGAADATLARQRQLMQMQDQYSLLRHDLAEREIAARLSDDLQSGQFSLLRRATATEAVSLVQNWTLIGVAGSLLLAVTLAFVLERGDPAAKRRSRTAAPSRALRLYRLFDDPARPILGMSRYLVTSALIVVWLFIIARNLT